MGEQIRIFNVGVLGETALPEFWVMSREEWDTSRIPGTRSRVDVEFLIGEGIAHAKPRQEYGVDPQRTRRGGSIDAAGSGEELLKLVVRRHLTTCVSNMGTSKISYRQQLNMKNIRITYTPKAHLDYM